DGREGHHVFAGQQVVAAINDWTRPMRQTALLAAVVLAAAFSTQSAMAASHKHKGSANLNQSASDLVRDSMTPWEPTTVAPGAKRHKVVAETPSSNPNVQSWRLFRDSLPVYWPTAVKSIVYPIGSSR